MRGHIRGYRRGHGCWNGYQTHNGRSRVRMTVAELLDLLEQHYRLKQGRVVEMHSHLKPVREALGTMGALKVTTAVIDHYIEGRLHQGRTAATVNRETQLLGQAYHIAVARGHLAEAPWIRKLPEHNIRQGFFEHDEMSALLAYLPAALHDFTRFAYLTGWRKSEIASLTWRDVDLEGKAIRLRAGHSKNRRGRLFVLEGELWEIILRRASKRHGDFVFHRGGRPILHFKRSWGSACRKAGLEGKLFHDLCRTAIRNMVRAGVPERIAMDLSGRRTRSIFDRYNIVSEEDLRAAVLKTDAYLQSRANGDRLTSHKEVGDGRAFYGLGTQP